MPTLHLGVRVTGAAWTGDERRHLYGKITLDRLGTDF